MDTQVFIKPLHVLVIGYSTVDSVLLSVKPMEFPLKLAGTLGAVMRADLSLRRPVYS